MLLIRDWEDRPLDIVCLRSHVNFSAGYFFVVLHSVVFTDNVSDVEGR